MIPTSRLPKDFKPKPPNEMEISNERGATLFDTFPNKIKQFRYGMIKPKEAPTKFLTRAQFDALPEYSLVLPDWRNGHGYTWKRNVNCGSTLLPELWLVYSYQFGFKQGDGPLSTPRMECLIVPATPCIFDEPGHQV
jgi:hypothetical protein